ncbi:MAG: HU family DNA-binding protein [Thermodesulfobacteriota bacterium]|nr:HU family DNA-binding protein [Thermodesulfobacteriota bacterium]
MTKRGLVEKVSERLRDYPVKDVAFAVDLMLESMKDALGKGERIELRNFGVFSVRSRDSRMGRNPRTDKEVYVPFRRVPFFKVGRELKKVVNYGKDSYEL